MMKKSVVFLLFMAVATIKAATFMVSNTDDMGPGSLRQAILNANATPGADIIDITFSGTVLLDSPLPAITEQVTIDGTGQNFIIDGNSNAEIGLEFASGATNSEVRDLTIQNIGISTSGQSATGIVVDAEGITLDNLSITNVFGANSGPSGFGQDGGNAIGIQINADSVSVLNSSISNLTGGNGGSASSDFSSGGSGGSAISIEINSSNNTITNNMNLENNTGGNGGDSSGSPSFGGSGGDAISIDINGSNNTITNNMNLENNTGGNGGTGTDGLGAAGNAISIAVDGSFNVISDNDSLRLNMGGAGAGVFTGSGGGLAASFLLTGDSNSVSGNTNLGQNTGGQGLSGNPGGTGASFAILGTSNTILQNSLILSNAGGDGGVGGNGVHMLITGSGNDIRENLLNASHTAGSGPGGDGATFGILVDTGSEDSILTNSIFGSASQPGIQLINGGNDEQVEPTITSLASCGDLVSVTGELNNNDASLGNRQYIIEFFSNGTSSDPEQGQTFIGQITVTTDASGNVMFMDEFLPVAPVSNGDYITATATLNSGTPINNTSQFSDPLQIIIGLPVDSVSVESQDGDPVTITLSGMASTPMMFEILQQPTNGTLSAITPLTGPPNITAEVIYTPNTNFAGFDSFVYSFEDDDCIGIVTIKVLSGDPNRDLTPIIEEKYGPFCNLLLS